MSHSNVVQTNFIGTHESVYRDSPIGNLERIMVSGISPLQQGFHGDIKTCLSIGVHDSSALLASEQGIVSTVMSLSNSTAVGTELGCMPCINDIQRNILVKAPLYDVLLESKKRNPHDFTIEFLSFGTESFEVLNRNASVISQSHLSNILNDFSYSILDKVMFISFSPVQCLIRIGTSSISIGTQSALSFKQFLPSLPDVLPEVILMQNLTFRRDNGNSKAFAVHINSKNVLLQRQFSFFFGKISNNIEIWSQPICLTHPSVLEEVRISLEVPILFYGNGNSVSWINPQVNERHGHIESLTIAWNIEFESNSFGCAFASPYCTFQTGINLDIESISCFGFGKCLSMEVHESIAKVPTFSKPIEFGSCLQREVFEDFALFGSNPINLQKNSSFHTTNQIYVFWKVYNANTRQLLPPVNDLGFLVEIR